MARKAAALTIPEIAAKYGVSLRTVRRHWVNAAGFPDPIGTRPRPDGAPGTPFQEYDAGQVDAWRRTRKGRAPDPLTWPGDPDEKVTIGAFAARARRPDGSPFDVTGGTAVRRFKDTKTFPLRACERGQNIYRAGDLLAFVNNRLGPGNRQPRRRP